ncbi:hypothetical protein L3C95_29265 [Chitinophaga filiformis]|uniref:hypothetical protein n=1 Tax=Chitinophaga filiformis TaxID=104663 RepID=UPI001F24E713|nr:hypothetical protein [Chitinophaga filiformis]MCF6407022.1 hypothetical protein [Chitinophaga filiformis]
MKHLRTNHLLVVLLLSAVSAFATDEQAIAISQCATIPTTTGANINGECIYSPAVQCCYIASGSSSQYVTQTQAGANVIIRRNTSSMVTIFGMQ